MILFLPTNICFCATPRHLFRTLMVQTVCATMKRFLGKSYQSALPGFSLVRQRLYLRKTGAHRLIAQWMNRNSASFGMQGNRASRTGGLEGQAPWRLRLAQKESSDI
jgi:hypothetical protein